MDTFFIVCLMSLFVDVLAFTAGLLFISADRPRLGTWVAISPVLISLVLWAVFIVIAVHTGYVGPGQ